MKQILHMVGEYIYIQEILKWIKIHQGEIQIGKEKGK